MLATMLIPCGIMSDASAQCCSLSGVCGSGVAFNSGFGFNTFGFNRGFGGTAVDFRGVPVGFQSFVPINAFGFNRGFAPVNVQVFNNQRRRRGRGAIFNVGGRGRCGF